jgi:preprotein translocase SecE subunit
VAYKKDQGRFARMAAFWGLFLLAAYGLLGGLVNTLRGWLGHDRSAAWVDPFPLLGRLDPAMVIVLALLGVVGLAIHRYLNRPKSADLLIDTENELRKVTWPSVGETWTGTLAVVVTVALLLLFLTFADIALAYVLGKAMGVG